MKYFLFEDSFFEHIEKIKKGADFRILQYIFFTEQEF